METQPLLEEINQFEFEPIEFKSRTRELGHQILTEPPLEFQLEFETEVRSSVLWGRNSDETSRNVVRAFNSGRDSIMMESTMWGTRIDRDQYRLVARNHQPELVSFSELKKYKKIFLTGVVEDLGIFKQIDLYLGAHGSHLINVPPGQLARAWLGNEPIFLGPGPHVIHDQNFRKVQRDDLSDLGDQYIQHGIYHIIRIPPGKIAKVWIGTTPYFLRAHEGPYVFKHPTFRIERPLLDLRSEYIHHGNYHVLRIPEGKVAKVWFGTKPAILEARDEPYILNDPCFKLIPKDDDNYFEEADEEVILHGAIKRLMPRTGRVAVTYDRGQLMTFAPSREPIMITSSQHSFNGFLQINTQTLEFPSEQTQRNRVKQGAEDVNYEVFRTSDGLPIGVKLLVVYEIIDPDATLKKLNQEQILPHIESLVVADMGMVIQNCSSGDFLKSNQTQARSVWKPEMNENYAPSAPEFYEHLQDEVKNKLHDDFAEYGIKLVRLNVETPKILDQNIADKMAEFSLMNSEARAKEAVLDRNFNIAKQEATQKAKTIEIEQQQENSNKISLAEADLEAAKMRAQAMKIEAQAQAEAKLAQTEIEIRTQEMLLEVARRRGEIYREYPGVLQSELAQIQAQAMQGINGMVVSPEVASHYYGFGMNLIPNKALVGNVSSEFKNKPKVKVQMMDCQKVSRLKEKTV